MVKLKTRIIISVAMALGLTAVGISLSKLYKVSQTRKSYYDLGIKSLKQDNCDRANQQFASLQTHGAFLNKVDKLSNAAKPYQQECNAWQATRKEVDAAKENQNFAQVLVSYNNFAELHSRSALVGFAREEIQELFNDLEVAQLANDKSCKRIDSLVKHELIRDRDRNLPTLYTSCIEVYQDKGDSQEEFNHQVEFLTAYPNNYQALEVKQGLIKNPLGCSNAEQLQNNDAVAQWANLMPVVYLACGRAYRSVADYSTAIAFYQALSTNYPDSNLVPTAKDNLADIDREVAQIKAEMQTAAEIIQARITACTAGSFLFDWAIDLGEMISGKDCMTGQSLQDFERIMTVLPLIDGLQGAAKINRVWQVIDTVGTFTAVRRTQNLLADYQTLFNLLDDKEEIELLAAHNSNLSALISQRGKSIDLSEHHQKFAELLE